MKSRLFILMVLFVLVGVSSVSAQSELTYMSDSFDLDSGSDRPHRHYVYTAHSGQKFGGLINITEREVNRTSKVRVMLLNEANYIIFKHGGDHVEMDYIDVIEDDRTVYWEATYKTGERAYFVYWHMEPAGPGQQVKVCIEMWEESHQPSITTITYPTDTTTTTTTETTTTTDTGTTTPTEEVENIFLIYLLCGVLGGIGVIIIYVKVRPRKVKYVWESK